MADTVLSVRIGEELKQRFIEIAQENKLNNKDLMQMLVAHFELERIKNGKVEISQDIDELQRLTKRVAEIYLNMVERNHLAGLEQKNKEKALIEKTEQENVKLQIQLEATKEQEKERQILKDKLNKLNDEVKKIKEEHQVLKDLNELLCQKNSELEKKAMDTTNRLAVAEQADIEINNLREELSLKERQLEKLNFQFQTIECVNHEKNQQYEKKELETTKKIAEEINLLKRQQQIELKELTLSLQLTHVENVAKLKEENEKNIADLLERNRQLLSILNTSTNKEEKN